MTPPIDPAIVVGSLGGILIAAGSVLYFSNFKDSCAQCEHCQAEKRLKDEAARERQHQWLHSSMGLPIERCPLCGKRNQ